jgi:hypothetical protein
VVAERCRLTSTQVRTLASRGVEPQSTSVTDVTPDADLRHADWIDANPDLFG